ncbi:MAG TPA: rRNA maturation RNase YbeY [Nitrospiraceae bacterium]|nr:rRNA maturation RNase YbeY [Nitrospiraceae bacterium]
MPVSVRIRLRRTSLLVPALSRLIQRILSAAGEHESILSVEFIGDYRMRRLNAHYRGRDMTTDVLAFATREGPGPSSPLLGDVVISVPQAIRQAAEQGHTIQRELVMLLIHGILHLLGYDHERSASEARRMRRKECALLQAVVPIPALIRADESLRRAAVRKQ